LLLTLVGPWTLMATLVCIGLSGHAKLATVIASSALAGFVAGMLAAKFFLPERAIFLLQQSIAFVVATILIVGTAWIYVASRRRGHIPSATVWAATIVWSAATLASVVFWPAELRPSVLGYFFVAAAAALMIAPVAAAPLALSANRHR
jgi:hypothetical protein